MLFFISCVVAFGALTQAAVTNPQRRSGPQVASTIAPGSGNSENQERLAGMNDIVYTKEQLEWRENQRNPNAPPGAGVIDPNQRWSDAVLPFSIDASVPEDQSVLIPEAMTWIEDASCVRFVERTDEENYVDFIRKRGGCSSNLGFLGRGRQEINLGGWSNDGPCRVGTIAHEIMHTLGITHEQNRPDRDDHIQIDFVNIPEDWREQYEIDDPEERSVFGLPYNFGSIMHYNVFSPGDANTQVIFPRDPNVDISSIGQRTQLSDGDLALINAMYC